MRGICIRILVLNWRDIKNPAGGGAEVYTHQIMKRLCAKGHVVTLFSSAFPGCLSDEIIDGVVIHREGSAYTVYSKARKYYKCSKERYDVVVDEINTIPFMTPRFVNRGEKIVTLIHQLAREYWFYEIPYPLAWVGYHFLEDRWLKSYQDVTAITVSESTRLELLALGLTKLTIVPNGLNAVPAEAVPEKTVEPSMVFVGRMKKAKRPEDVVQAYRILKKSWPTLTLTMIGDGYYRDRLQAENKDVDFTGYVDRKIRDDLVKRSWLIAVPGIREGWGQVVTDSNALGTAAIGYDVPGLRDSVKNELNGLLVDPDPLSMSKGIERILQDKTLRDRLSAGAIEWSKNFSWDKSADMFEAVLKGA